MDSKRSHRGTHGYDKDKADDEGSAIHAHSPLDRVDVQTIRVGRPPCRRTATMPPVDLGLALQEIRAVFTVEASGGDLQSLIRGALERHLGKQEEAMERLKARRRSIDLIFREWSGLPWEANEASALCSAMREVSELDTGFLEGFARGGAAHARDVIAPVGDDGHANDNPPRMAEREPAGADLEASPRPGKSRTHHEDRSSYFPQLSRRKVPET